MNCLKTRKKKKKKRRKRSQKGEDSEEEESDEKKERRKRASDEEEEANETTPKTRKPLSLDRLQKYLGWRRPAELRLQREEEDDQLVSLGSLLSSFSAVFLQPFRSLTSLNEVDSRRTTGATTTGKYFIHK